VSAPIARTARAEALAREMLADNEAELLERVAELEARIATYRELLSTALSQAHECQREIARLRHAYHAALDERRRETRAA
jgi:chromosome segregation ATPase